MPSEASNTVTVSLEMPKGTKLEVTEAVIVKMEALARQEVKGIANSSVSVGGSESNVASLTLTLYPYSQRKEGFDSDKTAQEKIRPFFELFPGADFSFASSGMLSMASGSAIDIALKSEDLDELRNMSETIVNLLSEKGTGFVTEPNSDMEDGLPQINILVDRNRMYNFGLNVYGISNEIRSNISGQMAGRYTDGGDEFDIIVGLAEEDRSKLTDLEEIFVNSTNGQKIPLSNFSSWEESVSPVAIKRENQTRTVHITANAVPGLSVTDVQAQVEKIIQENIPHNDSVQIVYGGSADVFMENIEIFAVIILMAAILVFAVMASQFESFADPFIVIFTIPLSVIGIVAVYLMTGAMLNTITAVGLLILVGIIVNNGIVLVDYTNLLRKRGMSIEEACVEAAKSRLRPILMTTLTTVLALVPMAFFPGEGSEMVQPVGQTVFGGLSFGTLMTLFLMPVLYYIFNTRREKKLAKKAIKREAKRQRKLERLAAEEEARLQRGE